MLPKVIMHNTISLDGALKDFEMDLGLHYRIAGQYKLISPFLIGKEPLKLFERFNPKGEGIKLKLVRNEAFDGDHILLVYRVLK